MLRPVKTANPDLTIVAVATMIGMRLQKSRIEPYEDLRAFVRKRRPQAEPLVEHALDLLFLLGMIEYHMKNDMVEFRVDAVE